VRAVFADWDSYYTDLNLSGDDGIADMWEGLYRVTRGYFRLADMPEPDQPTLTALSRSLPGDAASACSALLPGALDALNQLGAKGIQRSVTTYLTADHARGILRGSAALTLIDAPILTPETVERFERDQTYFEIAARQAGVQPESCLLVSAKTDALESARAVGMQTTRMEQAMTLLDVIAAVTHSNP
jgi:FMN phosphatase YigB (HAD superfamily)